MKQKISLSPSSINNYRESQLCFFYNAIQKAPPDTKPITAYGSGGNVIHNSLERYAKEKGSVFEYFEEYWKKYNLDTDPGMNGEPLKKSVYMQSLLNAKKYYEKLENVTAEEKIKFKLDVDTQTFDFYASGIIDVQSNTNEGLLISDYKTSSSIDTGGNFEVQAKMYCYLIWKTKGILPYKVTFFYTKLNEPKSMSFSEQDIIEFEQWLYTLCKDIDKKGLNISNYDIGEIDSPFNCHVNKCKDEIQKRNNKKEQHIFCNVKNNVLYIQNPKDVQQELHELLDKHFSYFVEGSVFSQLYKTGRWDGVVHKYKRYSLPYALIYEFIGIVKLFNEQHGTTYSIKLQDGRDERVTNFSYDDVIPIKKQFNVRPYQEKAKDVMLQKKIGILNIGTGGGKSLIAAMIMSESKRRCLLLVNRIQLAYQTKDKFEEYYEEQTIGLMTEGNLDVKNRITVASVQTIVALLKRDKKDVVRQELVKYLYNVGCCIWDEAHLCSNKGTYDVIQKHLCNVSIVCGLTGTAFRSQNDTLEMNCVVGYPIYTLSTEELQKQGYLSSSECLFVTYKFDSINVKTQQDVYGEFVDSELDEESSVYDEFIVFNKNRNFLCELYCNKHVMHKKILVLVTRIKHGEHLQSKIKNSMFIQGSVNKKDRQNIFEKFTQEPMVLIGMSSIMSTGIDIPQLDVIINMGANKSDNTTVQSIGRVLRKSDNKSKGVYIDFVDTNSYYLASKQRYKILKEFGHTCKIIKEEDLLL